MMYYYEEYSIRPIEEKDLEMILRWRNSKRISSMMLTEHKITKNEHYNWFKKIKLYKPIRHFIFCYNNIPIGYIGFNNFNVDEKSCDYGVYLGDVNIKIPVDASLILYFFAIEYAFDILNVKIIYSKILEINISSIAFNKFIGFKFLKKDIIEINNKKEKVYCLQLHKKDWNVYKRGFKISKRIL